MEFHHRSIPAILARQNETINEFQKERISATQANNRLIEDDLKSQNYTHRFSPIQRKENFENEWDRKELGLYKELLEILHHRMNSIENELFPSPEEEEKGLQNFIDLMNSKKEQENQKGHSR